VLGVDDWALRKGYTYGTILVDLEKHRVVDLLPDRSASSLKAWLTEHSGGAAPATDGVGVADSLSAIGIGEGQDGGFLADKTLNSVGAPDLGGQVDHVQFGTDNVGHAVSLQFGDGLENQPCILESGSDLFDLWCDEYQKHWTE